MITKMLTFHCGSKFRFIYFFFFEDLYKWILIDDFFLALREDDKFTYQDFHHPKHPFECRIFRVSQSKIYWWQRVPQLSWVFLSLEWDPFASLVVRLDSNIPTWKLGSNQSHLLDLQMHLKIMEGKSFKLISRILCSVLIYLHNWCQRNFIGFNEHVSIRLSCRKVSVE